MEVIYATDKVKDFVLNLDSVAHAQTIKLVGLLKSYGHMLRAPHSKAVGSGMFELRLQGSYPVRILFCFHKGVAYLLHGFVKKRGPIKLQDLHYAQEVRTRIAQL